MKNCCKSPEFLNGVWTVVSNESSDMDQDGGMCNLYFCLIGDLKYFGTAGLLMPVIHSFKEGIIDDNVAFSHTIHPICCPCWPSKLVWIKDKSSKQMDSQRIKKAEQLEKAFSTFEPKTMSK